MIIGWFISENVNKIKKMFLLNQLQSKLYCFWPKTSQDTGRGLSGGYWELWEQRVNPYPIVDKQESIEGLLSASHHVGSRYMSCPLRGHEVSELSGFSFSFFKALLKYNRYTENTHI